MVVKIINGISNYDSFFFPILLELEIYRHDRFQKLSLFIN